LVENCKSILISLFQSRFVVSLIMVLMKVTVRDIIHGSSSIIKPKVIYHTKSVDLVTVIPYCQQQLYWVVYPRKHPVCTSLRL
jgi:hypothetical protein